MKKEKNKLRKTDIDKLKNLSKILTKYKLTAIEISENKKKYRIEKKLNIKLDSTFKNKEIYQIKENSNSMLKNVLPPKSENEKLEVITSPMVGIFYDNINSNTSPLIKIGQNFKKGDVLCVLEAMKTFTEIKADEDGIIKEICAKNGDLIEYSQPLFKYIKQ